MISLLSMLTLLESMWPDARAAGGVAALVSVGISSLGSVSALNRALSLSH